MKPTVDGEVPARCYYYLLEYSDRYKRFMMKILFLETKLHMLTTKEFWLYFHYATRAEGMRGYYSHVKPDYEPET